MDALEAEVRTERVELLEEEAEAPLDLAVRLRAPAPELVVEDDAALAGEALERGEVVVRRARAAVEAEERRPPALAGDPVPGAARPPVEETLQLDHLERPVRRRRELHADRVARPHLAARAHDAHHAGLPDEPAVLVAPEHGGGQAPPVPIELDARVP